MTVRVGISRSVVGASLKAAAMGCCLLAVAATACTAQTNPGKVSNPAFSQNDDGTPGNGKALGKGNGNGKGHGKKKHKGHAFGKDRHGDFTPPGEVRRNQGQGRDKDLGPREARAKAKGLGSSDLTNPASRAYVAPGTVFSDSEFAPERSIRPAGRGRPSA